MKIKRILEPSEEINKEVLSLQTRCFEWGKDDLKRHNEKYGTKPIGYILAYENKKMVGALNLLLREITYKDKKILLGGIGGVAVIHEHRGKGIASKLLDIGLEELKEQGCDIAFLSTNINEHPTLYTRSGFRAINRTHKVTGKSGEEYVGYGGMIAPLKSEDIYEEILNNSEIFDIQGQDW
jgi:predicted acetyltransferase